MYSRKLLWVISLIVLISLASFVLTACGEDKKDPFTTLDSQAGYESFSTNDNAVIVDVRNPDEWATTGVPVGALLIPLPEIQTRGPAELPRDKDIYVICNSGNRSRTASQILVDAGFQNVINIDGGIKAWLSNGFPVEAYTP